MALTIVTFFFLFCFSFFFFFFFESYAFDLNRYKDSMHRKGMANKNLSPPHPWFSIKPPSPCGMEPTAHLAPAPPYPPTYMYIREKK